MRRVFVFGVGLAGLAVGLAAWWRRHPRVGAAWVNRVADPWLVRRGVASRSRGEIGLLEHVGRASGVVRVTPVHPVRTADGFRIVVPLGTASQWASNVLAAGQCRLQVGEVVHELDEPQLVPPTAIRGLAKPATLVMEWLGFRYLVLHEFAEHAGSLESTRATTQRDAEPPTQDALTEAVAMA